MLFLCAKKGLFEWDYENGLLEVYSKNEGRWYHKGHFDLRNPSQGIFGKAHGFNRVPTNIGNIYKFTKKGNRIVSKILSNGIIQAADKTMGWMDFICVPCLEIQLGKYGNSRTWN